MGTKRIDLEKEMEKAEVDILVSASVLGNIVDAATSMSQDVTIQFTSNGVLFESVNEGLTGFFRLRVSKKAFSSYKIREAVKYRTQLTPLKDAVSLANGKEDLVRLRIKDSGRKMGINIGRLKRLSTLVDSNYSGQNMDKLEDNMIRGLKGKRLCTIDSKELLHYLKVVKAITHEENRFKIEWKSDNVLIHGCFDTPSDSLIIDLEEKIKNKRKEGSDERVMLSLETILNVFQKFYKLADKTTIYMSKDMPTLFLGGTKKLKEVTKFPEKSKMTFIIGIAPFIEEDDE